MKKNKGFSLVELIIVIAIMAILVGVIAPQLIRYIEKANVSSDVTTLDSIRSALTYAGSDPEFATSNENIPDTDNYAGLSTDSVFGKIALNTVPKEGIKFKSKTAKNKTAAAVKWKVNDKGQTCVAIDGTQFKIDENGTVTTPSAEGGSTD